MGTRKPCQKGCITRKTSVCAFVIPEQPSQKPQTCRGSVVPVLLHADNSLPLPGDTPSAEAASLQHAFCFLKQSCQPKQTEAQRKRTLAFMHKPATKPKPQVEVFQPQPLAHLCEAGSGPRKNIRNCAWEAEESHMKRRHFLVFSNEAGKKTSQPCKHTKTRCRQAKVKAPIFPLKKPTILPTLYSIVTRYTSGRKY